MKTNFFSSKMLPICVGISLVLCSASLLIFTISNVPQAHAAEKPVVAPMPWDAELRGSVGLGIVNDTAYFVVFTNPNTLYKASLRSAKDWYKY